MLMVVISFLTAIAQKCINSVFVASYGFLVLFLSM